jgi:hypothetical protein
MQKQDNPARNVIVTTIRRLIDRRFLRMSIETLHKPALSHECHGVPRGDEVYRLLYRHAESYARAHAEIWGVDLAELYAIMPALEHLRHLAGAPKVSELAAHPQD